MPGAQYARVEDRHPERRLGAARGRQAIRKSVPQFLPQSELTASVFAWADAQENGGRCCGSAQLCCRAASVSSLLRCRRRTRHPGI